MRTLIHEKSHWIRRRGSMLVMLVLLMIMFTAIASLGVDYGHVQLVKSEMQRMADVTARGYMEYEILHNQSYANTNGTTLYSTTNNPVDGSSGVAPTVTITWGYWTAGTSTFSTSSGTVPAVKVTVTRTAAAGNAVPLFWGGMIGFLSSDVHASAIAAEMGGQSQALNIPSTASPYLAGMPSGSSTEGGDTTANATPYQASSIPVTPGTWISFTNLAGTTTVSPGGVPYAGPGGATSYPVHHGQSWNNAPDAPGPENGIGDAVMYESATMGLFLTNSAPTSNTAPATVDWTNSAISNKATYNTIVTQQPFLIGTGKTTGSVTKQFLVPQGATRLYVGIWDGYEYYNNAGNLTGNVTAQPYVQLVQ